MHTHERGTNIQVFYRIEKHLSDCNAQKIWRHVKYNCYEWTKVLELMEKVEDQLDIYRLTKFKGFMLFGAAGLLPWQRTHGMLEVLLEQKSEEANI